MKLDEIKKQLPNRDLIDAIVYAETCYRSGPLNYGTSAVALRIFCEDWLKTFFKSINKNRPQKLLECLNDVNVLQKVPTSLRGKLRFLKSWGDKSAHTIHPGLTKDVVEQCIAEAHMLGQWLTVWVNLKICDLADEQRKKLVSTLNQLENHFAEPNAYKEIVREVKQRFAQKENDIINQKLTAANNRIATDDSENHPDTLLANAVSEVLHLTEDTTSAQLDLIDFYDLDTLTSSQIDAIEALDAFLRDPLSHVFILTGSAGTGKTFLMSGLTEYLTLKRIPLNLCAPTAKAAAVLKEKTHYEASTIHSTIYNFEELRVDDEDENTIVTDFILKEKLHGQRVFIVDEASMIADIDNPSTLEVNFGSRKLLTDIFDYLDLLQKDASRKVIFVGDRYQLPPVNDLLSVALDERYLAEHFGVTVSSFNLTDVVRQKKESGILKNAYRIRALFDKQDFSNFDFDTQTDDVTQIVPNEDNLLELYAKLNPDKPGENTIILAHANKDVNQYNSLIHNTYFDENSPLCVGEHLVCVKTVVLPQSIRIFNGERGVVEDILGHPIVINQPITGKVVRLEYQKVRIRFLEHGSIDVLLCLNPLKSETALLSKDERQAIAAYFRTRNKKRIDQASLDELQTDPYYSSLFVKYSYALTCHKAQGSEWDNVIVNCAVMSSNPQFRYRWLYTAITRAKKHLYLYRTKKDPVGNYEIITPERPFLTQDELCEHIRHYVDEHLRASDITIHNEVIRGFEIVFNIKKDEQLGQLFVSFSHKKQQAKVLDKGQNTPLTEQARLLCQNMQWDLFQKEDAQSDDEEHIALDPGLPQFLHTFHENLLTACFSSGLTVKAVDYLDWRLRYTFEKDQVLCQADILYKKTTVSHYALIKKGSSPSIRKLLETLLKDLFTSD